MRKHTGLIIMSVIAAILAIYVVYDFGVSRGIQEGEALFQTGGQVGYQQGGEIGYQQGAQFGYEQAVVQIIQQGMTCEPVPLFANTDEGNVTLNMIAVECLQAAQNQPQQ